jgi:hypothetical protein
MPDGLQSIQVVLSQAPAVEKVQDFDLRTPQYLMQAAAEADHARAARAQHQVQPSDRSRSGPRVAAEGEHSQGGPLTYQDRPERRAGATVTPAGERPRPGGIVDVVV